jgi:hypothetical protein
MMEDGVLSVQTIFTRLVAIAIIILFTGSPAASNYGTIQFYFSYICGIILELQPCKKQIRLATEAISTLINADVILGRPTSANHSAMDKLIRQYAKYQRVLVARCRCAFHFGLGEKMLEQFCLSRLTDTMVYVIYMLDRVVLDGPLQPTIYGMHRIYEASAKVE